MDKVLEEPLDAVLEELNEAVWPERSAWSSNVDGIDMY
jgi:hypothetical protein